MQLYIKNMVCSRCKMVVKAELEKLGLHTVSVDLGKVEIVENSIENQKQQLEETFKLLGFQLLDDKISKTVERIKNLIIDLVHHQITVLKTNLSQYLADNLQQDYQSISNLFSEAEGCTIEKYFINQKTEKIKELLIYNELNLSQIAFRLHYSSVAHLSNQFKKVTGHSPSYFKHLKQNERKPIDEL
jgi:AraC-like DNA-binding protein